MAMYRGVLGLGILIIHCKLCFTLYSLLSLNFGFFRSVTSYLFSDGSGDKEETKTYSVIKIVFNTLTQLYKYIMLLSYTKTHTYLYR